MAQKQCHKCLQWKDEEDFYWRFKGIIRHHICKECQKPFQRAWYEGETKERHKKNVYKRKLHMKDEAREYVWNYLSSHPCQGTLPNGEPCCESDPVVLEFHHVSGKAKAISEMVAGGYPTTTIQKEIDRCIVLCGNCHKRVTHKERGWFRGRK